MLAVSWVYGLGRFQTDIKFMLNISVGLYWKFCWGFFIPVSLLAIFVYFLSTYSPLTYQGSPYPWPAELAGYILTGFAVVQVYKKGGQGWYRDVLQVPLWMLRSFCVEGGVRKAFSPNSEWGPARQAVREEWRLQEKVTQL